MPDKPPPAHDVLAAEEFAVPAPDPKLHHEPPHDVLAAEEFEVPAPDPALHHGPVTLPSDPTGIDAPHDVLAAEEFALPAPTASSVLAPAPAVRGRLSRPMQGAVAGAGALAVLLVRHRHRHRPRHRLHRRAR